MPPAADSSLPSGHVPVLAGEVLELLDPRTGMTCVDCTVGRAGHARVVCERLGERGRFIGLDADPANVAYAAKALTGVASRVEVHHANFADLRVILDQLGVEKVDLLLADLGFASNQMDDPARGFSFQAEGPLDMRLDPTVETTAADLVNELPEKELADLIYRYGEERLSRRIARKIAETRVREPILTTQSLAALVRHCYGPRRQRIDPATRTFMALRIAVNQELQSLERLLDQLPRCVSAGGRAAIISFHSLEDRLVKHAFMRWKREGLASPLVKKPVRAGDEECRANPRSRSARLRGVRFVGG